MKGGGGNMKYRKGENEKAYRIARKAISKSARKARRQTRLERKS